MEYHALTTTIQTVLIEAGVNFKTFEHAAVRTSEEAAALRPEYTLAQGAKALIVQIKKKGVPKGQVSQSEGLEQEVASRASDDKLNSFGTGRQFIQIVVPGDAKFDPKKARQVLQAKDIRFATESEVAEITGGVEPGGVPPFGNLFGLPVYVDATLQQNDEIIFNAGDRRFSIALATNDYLSIVNPEVVSIV